MSETKASDEVVGGKSSIQWSYLFASSVIVLALMLIVGFLNIRNLQGNYKTSFFESSQAVSKAGIQTMEYGLKYGKTMGDFFTAVAIINEIHDYISSSDNVSIIAPDGAVYFTVFPKKTLASAAYKDMLDKLDLPALLKSGAQTVLRDEIHHEFMPIRGADGSVSAFLEVTFDDNILRSKTSSFTQSSVLAVLVVTLLGTLLFMFILGQVRTTNEKGEVRRALLMTIMIINVTLCQLIFTGVNVWNYRNVLEANAAENTHHVGELIKKNIDTVIAKGLIFQELDQIQSWMASVVSSAADIKGAVVLVNDGKIRLSSTDGLNLGQKNIQTNQITLPLKPDRANNQANLTMVLDQDNLQRKLMPMLVLSMLILLGSIVALVQVTFVMIFILNRRAISNLKKHNDELEKIVEIRTREIKLEKAKSDRLLLNILPPKVAEDLKEHGFSEPQSFDNVTVFFSDVVGFTTLSKNLEAKHLIQELSDIFTNFDHIIEKYNCQRIKTIGDAYLCVSGMPEPDPRHAQNLVNASLDIIAYLKRRNSSSVIQWNIRVGINSGTVVGGIVGVKKYLYDVFGDTINTASRMESNSDPMRINVSESTWNLIKDDFKVTSRGEFEVKGKGIMHMYFVEGRI